MPLLGGGVAPTSTMTRTTRTTILINDAHLLVLLGQQCLSMAIVGGMNPLELSPQHPHR
jgi:hypothetical protein